MFDKAAGLPDHEGSSVVYFLRKTPDSGDSPPIRNSVKIIHSFASYL